MFKEITYICEYCKESISEYDFPVKKNGELSPRCRDCLKLKNKNKLVVMKYEKKDRSENRSYGLNGDDEIFC